MCYLFHLFPLLLPEKMEVGSSWLGPQDGSSRLSRHGRHNCDDEIYEISEEAKSTRARLLGHPGAHFCWIFFDFSNIFVEAS